MYYLKFSDNTIFRGSNIYNSLWDTIPDKEISEWKYQFGNKQFTLNGYEFYNHQIEKVNIFNKEIITKLILMGRKANKVDCIVIDFKTKKVYKKEYQITKEYNNRPTTGWKRGIKNEIPLITCNK
jgi:hypothetical protein